MRKAKKKREREKSNYQKEGGRREKWKKGKENGEPDLYISFFFIFIFCQLTHTHLCLFLLFSRHSIIICDISECLFGRSLFSPTPAWWNTLTKVGPCMIKFCGWVFFFWNILSIIKKLNTARAAMCTVYGLGAFPIRFTVVLHQNAHTKTISVRREIKPSIIGVIIRVEGNFFSSRFKWKKILIGGV